MRVSGVLILVGSLHPEVAPQLKPWVQGILQEELLELLSSWTRKAKVGAWFAIPACPLTEGPAPWPKPGTCEFRSLGKKGTDAAIHKVSLRLTEASNTGADYKKKRYMCPEKYLPFMSQVSQRQTLQMFFPSDTSGSCWLLRCTAGYGNQAEKIEMPHLANACMTA